jgi:Asp-tRNA(Asn)/Glu-tRNA(Gln) amidotransferase A subunit family amidase
MAGIDICFLGLVELGERIRRRELSAREATAAVLERIGRLQPRLRAYATLTPDLALQAADRADREIARGAHRGPPRARCRSASCSSPRGLSRCTTPTSSRP